MKDNNVCVEWLNLHAGKVVRSWFEDYKTAGQFIDEFLDRMEVINIFDTYELPF